MGATKNCSVFEMKFDEQKTFSFAKKKTTKYSNQIERKYDKNVTAEKVADFFQNLFFEEFSNKCTFGKSEITPKKEFKIHGFREKLK